MLRRSQALRSVGYGEALRGLKRLNVLNGLQLQGRQHAVVIKKKG